MPAPMEDSPCNWVATLPDLQAMVHSLAGVEMLAVDVEHHHLHSYLGFVCLLQLSTGTPDHNDADGVLHIVRFFVAAAGCESMLHFNSFSGRHS